LLGNGDTLVALAGAPDNLKFFINKNDLWVMKADINSRPQPLARLELTLPDLQGASYLVEQDLARALTTGRFEKDGKTLTLESAVAATENLLWIKLTAAGGSFSGRAELSLPGQGGRVTAKLSDNDRPANIGREQHGGGRWYFDGEIADVIVTNAVLSGKAVGSPQNPQPFDGKTTWHDLAIPKMTGPVSVSAWIKANQAGSEANYILSKGDWDQAYSLGLSAGKLRWSVNGTFLQSDQPLPLREWVQVTGTFDGRNLRLFINSKETGATTPAAADREGGVSIVERRFDSSVMLPAGAACALSILPPLSTINHQPSTTFTVSPGQPVLLVAAVASRFDSKDFREAAIRRAAAFKPEELASVQQAHEAWWRAFWGQSSIEIPDKVLEQRYYLSQYVLASASRLKDFPPGLFGWVTTDTPSWNGDYHLNYNHVAPFYGLYAANHLEQADPCHYPILANADQARELCRKTLGIDGLLQYVGIGPKGSLSDPTVWMQKSNSGYSCVPLAFRWYATYDLDFARAAYPFVRDVALFWENWLKFEDGRYVIYKDAIHEGSGDNVNPILSLGLVRMVMNLALDMSTELGVDAARHAKWEHIRDHLSPFPTCNVADLPERFRPRDQSLWTLPIFRYTEKGTPWWGDNTLGIQHIFPAGAIGLDSPPELLERSRNQIRVLNRWVDFNGMNSFYAAAARVGYDPNVILQQMRAMLAKLALPNGMIAGNPHGMEHQSIVPNAIQEMLLQSHEGVLRFFPCWPEQMDASFTTLRARGAFLVSAERKNGVVSGVKILSEKGRACTVQNPWPGQRVLRNGREPLSGARFTFQTKPGETLTLTPES
jgi:hypothetical protein